MCSANIDRPIVAPLCAIVGGAFKHESCWMCAAESTIFREIPLGARANSVPIKPRYSVSGTL